LSFLPQEVSGSTSQFNKRRLKEVTGNYSGNKVNSVDFKTLTALDQAECCHS
jgi:hypothetical protein